jgi:hypothetical protein
MAIIGADKFNSFPLRIRLWCRHFAFTILYPGRLGLPEKPAMQRSCTARHGEPRFVTCAGCSWRERNALAFWQSRWERCGEGLLRGGAEGRDVWYQGGTEMVCHAFRNWDCMALDLRARKTILGLVRTWLAAVEAYGVNLKAYGEVVTAVYEAGSDWSEFDGCLLSCPFDQRGRRQKAPGFTYGPDPEDWAVDVAGFVGDFWDTVEYADRGDADVIELQMPGAWVDY